MPAKRIIVALLIIFVAVGGFVAGLVLLKQRQNLSEQAAVPGGQAEVSISPASGNYEVGDTINTAVSFNPANIAISGVAVRLTYPFSGSSPEVSVTKIELNTTLTSSGDWTCPTQTSTQQGSNVVVDIACANTSSSGFSANSDTLLANVSMKVNSKPATLPFVVRFDPALSVITRKSDNQDILLIPTSTGSFTVGGAVEESPTVTPTSATSPTPTQKVSATPSISVTGNLSATITPTTGELPYTGFSYPTIFGIGLGTLVIVGAMLLAI